MALVKKGYWQTTYWLSGYWAEDYWLEYPTSVCIEHSMLFEECFGSVTALSFSACVASTNVMTFEEY
jgi:hypothetical protein